MQHSPLPLVDIILCLGVPEFMVFAGFICYQFGMGALLDDRAAMEYGDLIAELAAGQAVAADKSVTQQLFNFGNRHLHLDRIYHGDNGNCVRKGFHILYLIYRQTEHFAANRE